MNCHKLDYEILGDDLQVVEIELDPLETVIAEAGAMNYLDDGISFTAKMGDGSDPKKGFLKKTLDMGGRLLTGESLFLTHFTNHQKEGKRRVSFSAPYPGKILPLNMAQYDNQILCQKEAFLAAAFGTKVGIAFQKKLLTGLFGGEGFILQKLTGDGLVFLHGGGYIVKKELNNQTLKVDTGCLMAFTKGIDYSIERAGNLKSMLFGGEGLFLASLKGQGTVWLHSLPFSRLAERVLRSAPSMGGSQTGEGSLLGQAGKWLERI